MNAINRFYKGAELDMLDYFVVNFTTENTIAGFLLLKHAIIYKDEMTNKGNGHYEIIDRTGYAIPCNEPQPIKA